MKSTLFSTLLTVTAGVFLTTISCKHSDVSPPPSTAGDLRVSAPFASQTAQFAFDVTKEVVAEEGQANNVFISPLSLHIALGMIMNGANGQTAQEIQKTLKLDAQTLTEANNTYQNLLENLPGVDSKVTLSLANSVWYRNTFSVETSFQDLLKQSFQAEVSAQNFDDAATVGKINNWASQKTNGKIPKVLDRIESSDIMFLMNALYFKGDWTTQFKPEQTIDSPFKLVSGTTTTVRMMRLNTALKHASRSTYTAFELPYGSGNFAMTVLLPAESTTADALINSFNGDEWTQLQQAMTSSMIDIGLPKFTMSYAINLNKTLSTLGMPTAFTDVADFTKINKKGGLTLSFVKQNTFVAVDEQGTEAAAVTTGGISVTSAPVPILCNRPFIFVIHEKASGTILFVGKIADPTKTSNT
ncbi:serpin family protein [Spirosoma foliorum]|uniref:Serpin family protein n=1 Tax=Spirosoma foliorum TaxID=2710596 RepID=A0A7G5GTD3_9BACT|nr:serpin family protein [Spirosoma foliorum]QMW02125.1 serpin family protein [Spirosoma foliorum]